MEQAKAYQRSLSGLHEQVNQVFRDVATDLLPTLNQATDSMKSVTANTNALSGVAAGLADTFKGVVTVGAILVAVFVDIGKDIGYGANVIQFNAVTAFEALKRIMLDVLQLGKQTATTFIDLASTVLDSEEVIKDAASGHFAAAREIISGDLGQIKKDVLAIGSTALDIPDTVGNAFQKMVSNGMAEWQSFIGDIERQWTTVSAFWGGMWSTRPSPHAPSASPGGSAARPPASGNTSGYTPPETQMKEIEYLDQKAKLQAKIIETNPYLTAVEKAKELMPILAQENDLLNQHIAIQSSIVSDPTRTPDEQAKAKLEIIRLESQQNDLLRERQKLQPQISFGAAWTEAGQKFKDQFDNIGQMVSGGVFQNVQKGIGGISNALTAMIMGTKSAGQAFEELGVSLLSSFIETILSAVIEAEVAIPILTALGVLSGGATAATGAGVVTAALAAAASAVTGFDVGGYTGPERAL